MSRQTARNIIVPRPGHGSQDRLPPKCQSRVRYTGVDKNRYLQLGEYLSGAAKASSCLSFANYIVNFSRSSCRLL